MRGLLVALALSAVMAPRTGSAAESVRLHAAGSLRAALTEIAQAFESREGARVEGKFGPSGVLREEIAKGVPAEVFASANMEHPLSLSRDGKTGPVVLFARNWLCAFARPGFEVDPANLVDRMLDSEVKLGTSTPKADPSGDYAWVVFRRIKRLRPGSFAVLDRKALELTGGSASPAPPSGRTIYGLLIERGDADLFLTYCTNARVAADEVGLRPSGHEECLAGRLPACALHPFARWTGHSRASRLQCADIARSGGPIMKLSARNQLEGTIVEVRKGVTTTHVRLDIGDGRIVTSAITNESAEELSLEVGKKAYAIIKSSDVMIAVD
jgi:molybdate transport system substrate-binding protein